MLWCYICIEYIYILLYMYREYHMHFGVWNPFFVGRSLSIKIKHKAMSCSFVFVLSLSLQALYSTTPQYQMLESLNRIHQGSPVKWIFSDLEVINKWIYTIHKQCLYNVYYIYTLPKFNIALKSYLPNRKVVFQTPFFRGYVKLLGCTYYYI